MTEVRVTQAAEEDLANLETEAAERILSKLEDATEWGPDRYLKRLSGADLYSIRAGDYRGICNWDRENNIIILHAAGHRRNVYDRNL